MDNSYRETLEKMEPLQLTNGAATKRITSREGLDKQFNYEENNSNSIKVKVAVRVRPSLASPGEYQAGDSFIPGSEALELDREAGEVRMLGSNGVVAGVPRLFKYDHVFGPESTQEEVYSNTVEDLVGKYMDGFNVTVLAYGQTSSGKTYTMGTHGESGEKGIVGFALEQLFNRVSEENEKENGQTIRREFRASYLELHNEELNDLIAGRNGGYKPPIAIREDTNGKIIWSGAVEYTITSADQALMLLQEGSIVRHTGETKMNKTSSRSHAIFLITQIQTKVVDGVEMRSLSKLNFVDLAGSERLKKTMASGERAKEGISINTGLLVLGKVISALSLASEKSFTQSGGSLHIPYRDSKLTRLLQDSLGGTAYTVMIACVSGSLSDVGETINTLKYASRAREIKNMSIASWQSVDKGLQAQIILLKREVLRLQQELERAGVEGNLLGNNSSMESLKGSKYEEENLLLIKQYETNQERLEMIIEELESENYTTKKAYSELLGEFDDVCSQLQDMHNRRTASGSFVRDESTANRLNRAASNELLNSSLPINQMFSDVEYDNNGLEASISNKQKRLSGGNLEVGNRNSGYFESTFSSLRSLGAKSLLNRRLSLNQNGRVNGDTGLVNENGASLDGLDRGDDNHESDNECDFEAGGLKSVVAEYEQLIKELEQELTKKNEELQSKDLMLSVKNTTASYSASLANSQKEQLSVLKEQVEHFMQKAKIEEEKRITLETELKVMAEAKEASAKSVELRSIQVSDDIKKETERLVSEKEAAIQKVVADFTMQLEDKDQSHTKTLAEVKEKLVHDVQELQTSNEKVISEMANEYQQRIDVLEEELQDSLEKIKDLEMEVCKLEDTGKQQQVELDEYSDLLTLKVDELTKTRRELEQRTAELSAKVEILKDIEKRSVILEESLTNKMVYIEELERELKEKGDQFTRSTGSLEQTEQNYSKLLSELADKNAQLSYMESQIAISENFASSRGKLVDETTESLKNLVQMFERPVNQGELAAIGNSGTTESRDITNIVNGSGDGDGYGYGYVANNSIEHLKLRASNVSQLASSPVQNSFDSHTQNLKDLVESLVLRINHNEKVKRELLVVNENLLSAVEELEAQVTGPKLLDAIQEKKEMEVQTEIEAVDRDLELAVALEDQLTRSRLIIQQARREIQMAAELRGSNQYQENGMDDEYLDEDDELEKNLRSLESAVDEIIEDANHSSQPNGGYPAVVSYQIYRGVVEEKKRLAFEVGRYQLDMDAMHARIKELEDTAADADYLHQKLVGQEAYYPTHTPVHDGELLKDKASYESLDRPYFMGEEYTIGHDDVRRMPSASAFGNPRVHTNPQTYDPHQEYSHLVNQMTPLPEDDSTDTRNISTKPSLGLRRADSANAGFLADDFDHVDFFVDEFIQPNVIKNNFAKQGDYYIDNNQGKSQIGVGNKTENENHGENEDENENGNKNGDGNENENENGNGNGNKIGDGRGSENTNQRYHENDSDYGSESYPTNEQRNASPSMLSKLDKITSVTNSDSIAKYAESQNEDKMMFDSRVSIQYDSDINSASFARNNLSAHNIGDHVLSAKKSTGLVKLSSNFSDSMDVDIPQYKSSISRNDPNATTNHVNTSTLVLGDTQITGYSFDQNDSEFANASLIQPHERSINPTTNNTTTTTTKLTKDLSQQELFARVEDKQVADAIAKLTLKKDHEILQYSQRLEIIQRELDSNLKLLKSCQSDLLTKSDKVLVLEQELYSQQVLITSLQRDIDKLEIQIDNLTNAKEHNSVEVDRLNTESTSLHEQIDRLYAQLQETKLKAENEAKDRDIWKNRFQDLQEEMEEQLKLRNNKKSSGFLCF
ncbi:Kinesin-like protein KIF27 [Zancudomyces culisetae]|uniref:Kinesin-like protein KIF27 n=1 Tax=Zancudomyces culisetae TaxID=1213189 RepID=A0A1R1PR10_ZANCU|nr:Kinesin-like protein KIF27 [Zancudomyces culisetae]|eukprot:OMH83371.1 Kinesin-like protein KIF27 [Zancudomyces culisetae]